MFDFSEIDGLVKIGYEETQKQIGTIKIKIQTRISKTEISKKRVLFRYDFELNDINTY
jgi:hypothetical protein